MKKKQMSKIASIVLAASLMASGLVGCGSKAEPSDTDTSTATDEVSAVAETSEEEAFVDTGSGELDTELHYAVNAEPQSIDISRNTAIISRMIMKGTVFETLYTMDENYTPVPELAESVDVSEDASEYVFHLRTGVKFHNGEEMTADDVVASMNKWIDSFSTAQDLIGDARFVKTDDTTVTLTMDHSCATLPQLIADSLQVAIILPASIVESGLDEEGMLKEDSFIGTGPYKFVEWKSNQYIHLTKFEEYSPYGVQGEASGWSGYKEANIPDLYFEFVTDASTRVAGIQTGEYDLAYNLPQDSYEALKANEDINLTLEQSGYIGLIFNKKAGLGADETFRQACAAAIDMDKVLTAAYGSSDFYTLNSSYVFKSSAWYSGAGDDRYNTKDLDKCHELLESCGYNGETFTLLVTTDYQDMYNAGVSIAQQLNEAGITTELLPVDWSTLFEYRADENKYTAFITTFSCPAVPSIFICYSESWAGWTSDENIKQLCSDINSATSTEDAMAKWEELQDYSWNYIPLIKLGDYSYLEASSTKLTGVTYFEGPVVWNAVLYK